MRQLFFIMIFWLVGMPVFCQTPVRSDSTEIPNFERCFRLLEENRSVYNRYNDSIFLFKDHVAWTNFFKRRAVKNTHLFLANREIINTVFDYFKQDRKQIPHEAYQQLCDGLQRLYMEKKVDPFIIRKTKCYRFTKRNVPKRKTKRLRYRCPPEPYSNSVRTDFFSYSNAIILENQQINTSI